MITSTGQYISGGITETGRIAFANVSETGEYAPTVPDYNGYFTMSGGLLFGGAFPLNTTSGITTSGITTSGGCVIGANMVEKQIPCELYSTATLAFGLADASINFKLEQQP